MPYSYFGPGNQPTALTLRSGNGGGGFTAAYQPTARATINSPPYIPPLRAYQPPESVTPASNPQAPPTGIPAPRYSGATGGAYRREDFPTIRIDPVSGRYLSSTPITPWADWHRFQSGLPKPAGPEAPFGLDEAGKPMTRGQYIKKQVDMGKLPYSALFGVSQLPEEIVPGAGFGTLAGDTAKQVKEFSDAAVPDFNKLKADFAQRGSQLNAAYDTASRSLDTGDYENKLNAADAAISQGLTPEYLAGLRDVGSQAGSAVTGYESRGQAALDAARANAEKYSRENYANTQRIADQITSAGTRSSSRWAALNNGGGASSKYPEIFARSTLPYVLDANRQAMAAGFGATQDALNRYLPFYGDVGSRQRDLAGFNQGLNESGYRAQVGDQERTKMTANLIQNVRQANTQQQLQLARQQFLDAGLPEQAFNEILAQQQRLKSGELSLLDMAAGLQQKYGAQRFPYYVPGADVAQTGQTNLPQPRYPSGGGGSPTINIPPAQQGMNPQQVAQLAALMGGGGRRDNSGSGDFGGETSRPDQFPG
jgi:hypothetical protein